MNSTFRSERPHCQNLFGLIFGISSLKWVRTCEYSDILQPFTFREPHFTLILREIRDLWYLGMSIFIVAMPYPNTMIPTMEAGINS